MREDTDAGLCGRRGSVFGVAPEGPVAVSLKPDSRGSERTAVGAAIDQGERARMRWWLRMAARENGERGRIE